MKNSGVFLAYGFAIINALIVGFSFLFTKTAVMASSPLDTLAHRFTIAFVVIVILIAFKLVKVDLDIRRFKKLIPLTLFYPALFFSFQAFGLKYSQSSDAGIIFAVIPILTTMLAAFFLNETTTSLQKLSIFASVFGVIFIFVMKGSSVDLKSIFGISLLLLSCLSIAGYSVMARSLTKQFTPQEITFFMLGVGFLFFNGAALFTHLQSGNITAFISPWSDFQYVMAILFLGVLASLVTSLLSNFILSKIKASQMSVFSNLSTVVSIGAGAVFLDERISSYDIIGSLFIVLGVVGTNYFAEKRELSSAKLSFWKEKKNVM
ncbi:MULTISPECIES: DMT family transporter [unclassified Bacillus (in: firmicutes)]|uniref:DMT family transporter n=1 Tax=unclassified Bacillus (in: firmicutes) TaxID=185979 RepID=UPI0008E3DE65|nr:MULTISPECIES: DMT family transporter [unclassified Bacillus (in: firmicutes)]SFB11844.1 Permease of the drug/metabolite transporter (DMT) superfamily [Bacillus sp. UNCCL13]SFQ90410.1 Permease of the drug/metabolite transporter (DMT) superfamily [Bacillus sp. cl95]